MKIGYFENEVGRAYLPQYKSAMEELEADLNLVGNRPAEE